MRFVVAAGIAIALGACASVARPSVDGDVAGDASADARADVTLVPTYDLDLLIVMNSEGTMRDNQTAFMASTSAMAQGLLSAGVRTLHIGVISMDLGTPGHMVPGCSDRNGDDGRLNPIRFGEDGVGRRPWLSAPAAFGRPADCIDENEYPAFISFDSTAAVAMIAHDTNCNAGLYVSGCTIYHTLESIQRALIEHDATDRVGNTSPNAGFVRADALLAILALTDKDDESARDCSRANGAPCVDGTDVFDYGSTRWSAPNIRLRFYMYRAGGPQDPTWPLERYVDPHHPQLGWLALKPGHPERIVFGAIIGVPLTGWQNTDGTTNWDALVGAPAADPDDYVHRDSTLAIRTMSAEGPVSMMGADLDPACPLRVVPACRRQGTMPSPTSCSGDLQYFALPARRITEIARRFDQSALCNGAPCHNGYVASICGNDDASAIAGFVQLVQRRIGVH